MPDTQLQHYRVYGLRLSANCAVPGMELESGASVPADLRVEFFPAEPVPAQPAAAEVIYTSPPRDAGAEPFFKVWKDPTQAEAFIGIQYANRGGRAVFQLSRDGRRLRVDWDPGLSFQDVVAYFLGPVLGCVLRLRQVVCLHAAAAYSDGRAIIILGPKGSGKSTTIAALAWSGWPVLTDDIAVLTEGAGEFLVQPGYPRLRLWPEAVPGGLAAELPRVLSFIEKRYQPLTSDADAPRWKFQPRPARLAAVYLLAERTPQPPAVIVPLDPAAALLALVGNVYPEYRLMPDDTVRHFQFLGRLTARVPVRLLSLPDKAAGLQAIRAAIADDCRSLIPAEPIP